jgi:hypothetical protein
MADIRRKSPRIGSWNPGNFPNLNHKNHIVTSDWDRSYNCIAWAAGCNHQWWEPVKPYYWPPNAPREITISAYAKAFETVGYTKCANGNLEEGFEKIAIFAAREDGRLVPTHAARQLPDGRWASKLGKSEDIEHLTLKDLDSPDYGKAVRFMRRPRVAFRPS